MILRRRRGASTLGCLFSLLLMAVLLYYGVDIGRVFWKYYKLEDEMAQSARFASIRSDEEIIKHLIGVARDLELPPEAQRFRVRRTQNPSKVTIDTQYRITLELPFHHRIVLLKPHAEVRP